MFAVAPRYLSGVSVFIGDDITKREQTGQLVYFIGPATKGERVPLNIQSIDGASAIYGAGSPIVKAMYQFYDGYSDGGRNTPLRFVAQRIGGIPAKVTLINGIVIETKDAYTGIENEYYAYVNDTTDFDVMVWNKNKLLVYSYKNNINSGHVNVTIPTIKGTTNKIIGTNIINDPLDTPTKLGDLWKEELYSPSLTTLIDGKAVIAGELAVTLATAFVEGATEITLAGVNINWATFPSTGFLRLLLKKGALFTEKFIQYSGHANGVFTVDPLTFGSAAFSDGASSVFVKYTVKTVDAGDSQIDIPKRTKYEMFKNALLDIETYTPDYIIPGGVYFDEVEQYQKAITDSTTIKAEAVSPTANTFLVDAASVWGQTGYVFVAKGTQVKLWDNTVIPVQSSIRYNGIVANGLDYNVTLMLDEFNVEEYSELANQLVLTGTGLGDIPEFGFCALNNATGDGAEEGYFQVVNRTENSVTINIVVKGIDWITTSGVPLETGTGLEPITTFSIVHEGVSIGDVIAATWTIEESYPMGIGFVKETYNGFNYTFEWKNTKETAEHKLAHFGYLFADFCNEAAVGYNTPLTGMNITPPVTFDRAALMEWIGAKPIYKTVIGDPSSIESVLADGTGALGNPVMAGNIKDSYNRAYLSDSANNFYADPAFGLLLTDDRSIDGSIIFDSYNELVDLGKFITVGGALLTFNHGSSGGGSYVETMGIYTIGVLAGKKDGEGCSFTKLGQASTVSVGVQLNRKLYNELASVNYVVLSRENGIGWVVNNDPSVARKDSGYKLISTTKIVKTVIEDKRSKLASFIGKPLNTFYYEAAKTKMGEAFKNDVKRGLLNGFNFTLEVSKSGTNIGKMFLKAVLNPPLEITNIDVDTVIDRNVTSV